MSGSGQNSKKRLNWRGFASQLFLLTILPLTALLLMVVFGSQMLHHDAMRSLVADRDLRTVMAAAASMERELAGKGDVLMLAATSLENGTDLLPDLLDTAALTDRFDGGIAVYAPDGSLLQATPNALAWSGMPPETREFPESGVGQPSFRIHPASTSADRSYILVSVRSGNQEVITGAFSIAGMAEEALGSLTEGGQTAIWLLYPAGTDTQTEILYGNLPSSAAEDAVIDMAGGLFVNGVSGIRHFESSAGDHVIAYSPVAPAGFWLVMEETWDGIASPSLSTTQSAPLILVPVFLVALAALWFGARRIVKPLQELERQAVRLAGGDFQAVHRPVGGIEEIRSLQNELARMADRLQTAQLSQRSYIGAITAGVENERRNLARELHDDTIQSLIALNQRIQLSLMDASGSQKQVLLELQKLVQGTMVGLRRLIRGLRPIYLEDLGLTASLRMLVQEMEQAAGLPVHFELEGVEQRLDPQVEMSLYRMVQESLSNVARHSGASQAGVRLSFSEGELVIGIIDNGKGFNVPSNPSAFPEKGHFGLLGLQERAEILQADLSIVSDPGSGTAVTIHLCDLHRLAKASTAPPVLAP